MPKQQTSITVDELLLEKIKEKLKAGAYRNQSHLFEFAARQLLENENSNVSEINSSNVSQIDKNSDNLTKDISKNSQDSTINKGDKNDKS